MPCGTARAEVDEFHAKQPLARRLRHGPSHDVNKHEHQKLSVRLRDRSRPCFMHARTSVNTMHHGTSGMLMISLS